MISSDSFNNRENDIVLGTMRNSPTRACVVQLMDSRAEKAGDIEGT